MSEDEGGTEPAPPHAKLVEMAMAHWLSHIVWVAAKLGLADRLADGSKTAEELAGPTGTHGPSLHRFMRALANLGMFALSMLDYQRPYIVWVITIPAWIYTIYRSIKQNADKSASTHFDRISASLWMCYAICIFTVVAFGYKINFQIGPIILIMSAVPTFVSGIILRFKPLMIGGILFWVFGIISFLVPNEMQSLAGAVAILCGYLVPGYILKNKHED